ncbi:hypothetical protein RhiirC2_798053 [Rhizophagus irregularis]|uniref:Uncharacterized protein n=1 Tax=Rhizophagus irregularis TaxID=588596 RepID=A0A2N1M713_9GLOM|nr:hypothetical protein RhiirC2_798053 [Rhizophagus irregularis]
MIDRKNLINNSLESSRRDDSNGTKINRWRVNFANFSKNNSPSIDTRRIILVPLEPSRRNDFNKLLIRFLQSLDDELLRKMNFEQSEKN